MCPNIQLPTSRGYPNLEVNPPQLHTLLKILLVTMVTFQEGKLNTWGYFWFITLSSPASNSTKGLDTVGIYPLLSVDMIASIMQSLHMYSLDWCNSLFLKSSCYWAYSFPSYLCCCCQYYLSIPWIWSLIVLKMIYRLVLVDSGMISKVLISYQTFYDGISDYLVSFILSTYPDSPRSMI